MLRRCWLVLLVACGCGPAAAAGASARLTLLDGTATLQVDAATLRAAEGVQLPAGTLVDTDAGCALLRIEWPDGSALDLGPDSHAMLAPPDPGSGTAPAFYLLRGWAKYSSPRASHGWYSPWLDVAPARGVTVASIEAGQARLFAESGEQQVIDRFGGRRRALAEGVVLSAVPGRPAETLARPPADWLARLPRAFRDTLPLRLESFQGREVAARPAAASSYAVLAPWLSAEPVVRHTFAGRFAGRLSERAFRAAVTAHLGQHPEWGPLLAPRIPSPTPSGATR